MIFCSTDRYIPTNNNILTIQGDDGMYYYIHRSLYDQAVILSNTYDDKKEVLYELLDIDTSDVPSCIEYFDLVVPKPLNILAGFLSFVKDYAKLPDENIETLCGVIHQISSVTNFVNIIHTPSEVRASVSFSLSITEEYKLSWDRFFQECIPYDEELFLSGARAYFKHVEEQYGIFVGNKTVVPSYVYPTMNAPLPNAVEEEEEHEPEEGIDEPFDWDAFEDSLDNADDEEDEAEEAEEEKETVNEESDEEAKEETDDGRNFLLSMAMKTKGES